MKELVIYRCSICGNLVCMVKDSGVVPSCCGQEMELVKTNITDGALEKHLPVISGDNQTITVTVGVSEHPMTDSHYIEWIALVTDRGMYMKPLYPGYKPQVCFHIYEDETVTSAYAYCNIHGLWMKSM